MEAGISSNNLESSPLSWYQLITIAVINWIWIPIYISWVQWSLIIATIINYYIIILHSSCRALYIIYMYIYIHTYINKWNKHKKLLPNTNHLFPVLHHFILSSHIFRFISYFSSTIISADEFPFLFYSQPPPSSFYFHFPHSFTRFLLSRIKKMLLSVRPYLANLEDWSCNIQGLLWSQLSQLSPFHLLWTLATFSQQLLALQFSNPSSSSPPTSLLTSSLYIFCYHFHSSPDISNYFFHYHSMFSCFFNNLLLCFLSTT